jgi:hypothetical protein
MKIIGIGHSHISAIKWAANARAEEFSRNGIKFEIISIVEERYRGFWVQNLKTGVDGFSFHKNIEADLGRMLTRADLVFSCFGGNAHNIFGLVQHPKPFDFVLRENPELPIAKDVEILPSFLVESAIKQQGGFPESAWGLKAIRSIYLGPIIHCESPPPVPSEDHLMQNAGVFKDKIEQLGLAPRWLRYKLWRLHSHAIKRLCAKNNIAYLGAPLNFLDKDGFLTQEGWNPDATHANINYGHAVVNQLINYGNENFDLLEKKGNHAPL